MKKIILMLYNIELAEIIDKNGLTVVDYKENVDKAKKEYPFNMREYKLGLSGYYYPIDNYFNAINRGDIIKEAGITQTDSVFEKLYKVAGLSIQPINGFYIKQK